MNSARSKATRNATALQTKASRANGSMSHGPKTEEGKRVSSRNSVKLGVYSQTLTVPEELQEKFEIFSREIAERFSPRDAFEKTLVARIVVATWRIQILTDLEEEIFWEKMDSGLKQELVENTQEVRSPFARQLADLERSVTRATKDLENSRKGKFDLPKEPVPTPVQLPEEQIYKTNPVPKAADPAYIPQTPEYYARQRAEYDVRRQEDLQLRSPVSLDTCKSINSRGGKLF